MNYIDINTNKTYSLKEAFVNDLGAEMQLIPENLPIISKDKLFLLCSESFSSRVAFTIKAFFEELDEKALSSFCEEAFSSFLEEDPAPVISLSEDEFVLELNRGENRSIGDLFNALTPYIAQKYGISPKSDSYFSIAFNVSTAVCLACIFSSFCDFISSDILKENDNLNIAVSSDASPLLLAILYAKKMGLPIKKIIVGGEEQDAVCNFLLKSECSPSKLSKSFKPLLYEISGRNPNVVPLFNTNEEFTVDGIQFLTKDFFVHLANEDSAIDSMAMCFDEFEYLFDTFSAYAVCASDVYAEKTKDYTPVLYTALYSPYYTLESAHLALFEKEPKNIVYALTKVFEETGIEIPPLIDAIIKSPKEKQTFSYLKELLKNTLL